MRVKFGSFISKPKTRFAIKKNKKTKGTKYPICLASLPLSHVTPSLYLAAGTTGTRGPPSLRSPDPNIVIDPPPSTSADHRCHCRGRPHNASPPHPIPQHPSPPDHDQHRNWPTTSAQASPHPAATPPPQNPSSPLPKKKMKTLSRDIHYFRQL